MNTPNPQRLLELGFLFPVSTGIQIDLNVVPGGSLCDHNCTTQFGGYDCPDAFTRSKPGSRKFASGETIIRRVLWAREGVTTARKTWLQSPHFVNYANEFIIPAWVREAISDNILNKPTEVNLFGGNPEMHTQILSIITELKDAGFRVNFTTTGRRLMNNEDFAKAFANHPPHLLALSLDDTEVSELEQLLTRPLSNLFTTWRNTNSLYGQRQKMLEGIYTARLAQDNGWDCKVLFNMVMSPKNLRWFPRILSMVAHHLPGVLLNPYPAQDSFDHGPGVFEEENTQIFASYIPSMIDKTLSGNKNLTKRLPYWLAMAAVLQNCGHEHLTAAGKMISGHGIWTCYSQLGTGMYVQLGQPNKELVKIGGGLEEPGGYLGCYWNHTTVTSPAQITAAGDVITHMIGGTTQLAKTAKKPCPGCSMPRLWFDGPNTELGLNPGLRDSYLALRKEHMGF